jgi:hypothetical protein
MTITQRFRIAESLGLSEKREKSVVVGWGLVSQDHIHFIGTKALQRKTVAFEATIWEWFTPSIQFVSKITCAILGDGYYYILLHTTTRCWCWGWCRSHWLSGFQPLVESKHER